MTLSRILTLGAVLAWLAAGVATAGEERPPMPQIVKDLCQNCHGVEGRNSTPIYPQLAGQTAPYLEAQLTNFRSRDRAEPLAREYMWGMAGDLRDKTIKEIAAYYAAQAPAAGTPQERAEAAAGQDIFANGISSEGVPACKSCHGDKGQGANLFPRLAGQHYEYTTTMLFDFRKGRRENDIMYNNVKNMTDEQIRAVSAYIASIGGE